MRVFEKYIRAHPELFDTEYIRETYNKQGLKLFFDPLANDLLQPAKEALLKQRPFSAVRIGDGEANFLAFGAYKGTPNLDRYAFAASIANQKDSFRVNETWMLVLRELMRHAVLSADIVGVLGLWTPIPAKGGSLDAVVDNFHKDPRGVPGHLRGIDLMLRWATEGHFKSKCLAPAHLYFSVICHLEELILLTEKVICITDKQLVVDALRQKFSNSQFEQIIVGKWQNSSGSDVALPGFLSKVEAELPEDMTGCLCLIGAGVWAEFYCTLAKQRGGVAIDIGSGFDLLAGISSRPVHKYLSDSLITNLKIINN